MAVVACVVSQIMICVVRVRGPLRLGVMERRQCGRSRRGAPCGLGLTDRRSPREDTSSLMKIRRLVALPALAIACAIGLGLLFFAAPPDAETVTAPATEPMKTSQPDTRRSAGRPRATASDTAIRPFRFRAEDSELAELRRRIVATRWPEKETVADQSQGVPLAIMQELAHYWATDYDWQKGEAKLNALPQ